MIYRFKHIFSIVLLLVFLTPIAVQLFHNKHNHLHFEIKKEKQINLKHEKCKICNFNFSIFSKKHEPTTFHKISVIFSIKNIYKSIFLIKSSFINYSLRAPPIS